MGIAGGRAVRRACVVLALTMSACGGGPSPGTDAGTSSDAASAPDTGGGSDSIAIGVFEAMPPLASAPPIPGGIVGVDDASGRHVEATAGADGIAHVTGLDWARGPFDVVVTAPGHNANARVGLDRATYEAQLVSGNLPFFVRARTATATISGAITGRTSPSHSLFVQSTTGGYWQGTTPPYHLDVPGNRAFRLLAVETSTTFGSGRDFTAPHYLWSLSDEQPATTAASTVDIDLTMHGVTPHSVDLTYDVPAGAAGSFFATASAYSQVYDTTNGQLGFPAAATFSTDGMHVSVTLEWIDVPGTPDLFTYVGLLSTSQSSFLVQHAAPTAGAVSGTLITPIGATESGTFAHVHDTVTLTAAPPADITPIVVVTVGAETRYAITGPIGAQEVPVPQLPSGADADLFTGEMVRTVRLCHFVGVGPDALCDRIAQGSRNPVDP